eukprot:TRINITY_DN39822_c0_g1_i2.p1 TRINITY_DN39822_c0_g1~~TRINITY_DN39822_c0_g1_i2.p1  ORF type:complete len:226 (-),score=61.05 TRINITY_DN39822_c0_g1_i2:78-755(-)
MASRCLIGLIEWLPCCGCSRAVNHRPKKAACTTSCCSKAVPAAAPKKPAVADSLADALLGGGGGGAVGDEQQQALDFMEQLLSGGPSKKTQQQAGPRDWSRELYDACWQGDFEMAFNALEKGADKSQGYGSRLNTALHIAARTGHPQLLGMLVAQGAPIDAKNTDGETPLFGAVIEQNVGATQALVDAKADINARDNERRTVLSVAIEKERQDFVEFLRGNGATQ